MLKQYVVRLREQERRRLRKLVSSGAAPARKLTRARILLKADVGERPGGAGLTDRAIAEALDAS
jgi:hypothetical protein